MQKDNDSDPSSLPDINLKIPRAKHARVLILKLYSGEPVHAESGYWRPEPDGTIEIIIAQSSGLVEVPDKPIKLWSQLEGNASRAIFSQQFILFVRRLGKSTLDQLIRNLSPSELKTQIPLV
ncbi:hypothetical protein SADUNF_Sadunf08G0064400 [Salix dunnii]|uniref:THAP4-like heme-binding domain-containing protein n=1 Tax=Salix dunnii TaxID=1413687 RepID=A0A835JT42_9ROSI|nr:hypothetical protein SADUNF_Sadunf08G0064400 [Salix dunnii]